MNINAGELKKFLAHVPDHIPIRLVLYMPGYIYNESAQAFGGLLYNIRSSEHGQELHILGGPNLPPVNHLFNLQQSQNESELSDSDNNNTAGQQHQGPEISRYPQPGELFD